MTRRGICAAMLVAALSVVVAPLGTARESRVPATLSTLPPECDRNCLYGFIDHYVDALGRRDASRLPWARNARYTENNVELAIGDGVWATATKLGDYKLRFADVQTGQVGLFGVVEEAKDASGFSLRLKIENRQIAEAEILILRIKDFPPLPGGVNPFEKAKFEDKPIMQQALAPKERRPRERLISIADGYFDTLQLNDGQLFTEFDPQCNRYENGLLTTNNPAKPLGELSALGCAEQFKLGAYRYDDRLRARRFPLVDEERGLVLGMGFIDHSGRIGTFTLTNGKTLESPIRRPHSFCLMELFKIVDGKIRQIEAIFITVPYNMPSPWVE